VQNRQGRRADYYFQNFENISVFCFILMLIRIQLVRSIRNGIEIQSFDNPNFKKLQLKINLIFLIKLYLSLGFHIGRKRYRRSLQPSKRTSSTSKLKIFVIFLPGIQPTHNLNVINRPWKCLADNTYGGENFLYDGPLTIMCVCIISSKLRINESMADTTERESDEKCKSGNLVEILSGLIWKMRKLKENEFKRSSLICTS
jgi:hypothetical protein